MNLVTRPRRARLVKTGAGRLRDPRPSNQQYLILVPRSYQIDNAPRQRPAKHNGSKTTRFPATVTVAYSEGARLLLRLATGRNKAFSPHWHWWYSSSLDWFATAAESTSRTLIPYGLSEPGPAWPGSAKSSRRTCAGAGDELRDAGAHAMCLGSINWTACLGAGVTPKSSDGD